MRPGEVDVAMRSVYERDTRSEKGTKLNIKQESASEGRVSGG